MKCPKCGFENDQQATECVKCGIVFAKYGRHEESLQFQEQLTENARSEAAGFRQELKYRMVAIPAALICARVLVGIAPALVRIIAMLVHESGHAVTAWLCGYWAVPGLWFTPVSDQRELWVTVLFLGVFGFGVYWSWTTERWGVAGLCAAGMILELVCTRLPSPQAKALISFGGDGGSLVLGSLLMTTVYARTESALCENSLRWGFLAIGAFAFVDAFSSWTGKEEDIPFGIQEGSLSDPSALVETYGWTIQLMMQRYVRLAGICLSGLAIAYVIGIVRKRSEFFATTSS